MDKKDVFNRKYGEHHKQRKLNDITDPNYAPEIICESCNEKNKQDAKYCTSCGQGLYVNPDLQEQSAETTCPNCQQINELNAKFCSNCGQNMIDYERPSFIREEPTRNKLQDLQNEPTDKELILFANPNGQSYLNSWKKLQKNYNSFSWNWAASFFTLAWFAYRKMYLSVVLIGAAVFIISLLASMSPFFNYLDSVIPFIMLGYCGSQANRLYYDFTRQKIREIKAEEETDAEITKERIKEAGGVNPWAVVVSIFIFILMVFILIGIEDKLRQ